MLICVKSKHGCSSGMMSWNDQFSCVLTSGFLYKDSNNVHSEIHYFKDGLIPLFCSVQPCCSGFYTIAVAQCFNLRVIFVHSTDCSHFQFFFFFFSSYSLYSRPFRRNRHAELLLNFHKSETTQTRPHFHQF